MATQFCAYNNNVCLEKVFDNLQGNSYDISIMVNMYLI